MERAYGLSKSKVRRRRILLRRKIFRWGNSRRGIGKEKRTREPDRQIPQSDHVPYCRFCRPRGLFLGAYLWRECFAGCAQVLELSGDSTLPQIPYSVWF